LLFEEKDDQSKEGWVPIISMKWPFHAVCLIIWKSCLHQMHLFKGETVHVLLCSHRNLHHLGIWFLSLPAEQNFLKIQNKNLSDTYKRILLSILLIGKGECLMRWLACGENLRILSSYGGYPLRVKHACSHTYRL